MVRVILADDQVSFVDALKYTLEKSKEVEVVACAYNGREAYELSKEYQPDIVLMDLLMPVCDGIEGTRLIKDYNAKIKVLVLTTFNDEDDISKALQNGADGYVLKEVETSGLISAISSVVNGLGIVQVNVLKKVSKMINEKSKKDERLVMDNYDLNSKEMEITKYVVHGLSNKDIGVKLKYSEGTIKNMIRVILSKVDVRDRTQLAVFAIKNKLV